MADLEPAVGVFEDFHLDASVAGTLGARQELQSAPVVFHCVVPSYLAGVLEAEDLIQRFLGDPGAVGRHGQLGRYGKLGVVAGRKSRSTALAWSMVLAPARAQFGHQPILEGSGRTFHTAFGLRRAGENLLDAQFGDGFAEVRSLHRRLDVPGLAGKLEHAVAVAVECDGASQRSIMPCIRVK